MANSLYHIVALYTVIFIWILATKARVLSDNSGNLIADAFPSDMKPKSIFFSTDELVPNLEFDRSYRSPKKLMRPRATRVGFNNMELFTARGYGKRSSENCKSCKDMGLIAARRFGKREPEKLNKLLCMLILQGKQSYPAVCNDDISNLIQRRDKEIPEENTLDED